MVLLYCMAAFAFISMVSALTRCSAALPTEERHNGYYARVHVDGTQIVGVELMKDDKVVCIIEEQFKTEQEATQAVLTRFYKKLEADYVQRTRRVNYAIGERQTVAKIKKTFAHTLRAREIQELMSYDETESH